jgi:septum site-determining protein MinC
LSETAAKAESGFHLKGSMLTVMVLELFGDSTAGFPTQLAARVERAPQLLRGSPVIISLEKFTGTPDADSLRALADHCREYGLQPLGFRAGETLAPLVTGAGLVLLPPSTGRGKPARGAVEASLAEQVAPDTEPAAPVSRRSRLVTQPVRSGQQVYARDADLIVMSQVSEGAEILADGNIHVYGGLRGRALAGVQGDSGARIFCQRMEAELLSVAGNFVLSEDMPEDLQKQAVQVFLDDEKLCLEPL